MPNSTIYDFTHIWKIHSINVAIFEITFYISKQYFCQALHPRCQIHYIKHQRMQCAFFEKLKNETEVSRLYFNSISWVGDTILQMAF